MMARGYFKQTDLQNTRMYTLCYGRYAIVIPWGRYMPHQSKASFDHSAYDDECNVRKRLMRLFNGMVVSELAPNLPFELLPCARDREVRHSESRCFSGIRSAIPGGKVKQIVDIQMYRVSLTFGLVQP